MLGGLVDKRSWTVACSGLQRAMEIVQAQLAREKKSVAHLQGARTRAL